VLAIWWASELPLSDPARSQVANGELEKPKIWDPVLEVLAERGTLYERGFIEHIEAGGLTATIIEGVGVMPNRSPPPAPPWPAETRSSFSRGLPHTTEAERLVIMRVGQDVFRDSLMQYWNSRCPLTGIAEPELLRASHIVPWAVCESDAERLDVHNGLLLSALWDAAFDKGLISFADDGTPLASPQLSAQARAALNFGNGPRLRVLKDAHLLRLKRHRLTNGFPS
jgi:hypothetical protein